MSEVEFEYEDFADFDDGNGVANVVWFWNTDGKKLSYQKYQAKNVVAGDTDSVMMLLKPALDAIQVKECEICTDDVCDLADTVAEKVNDSFPDFIQKAFNTPPDRKHSITTGREVVFDKALFLSKKRYIMHVVDDEGKRVDKLKTMGVEIKKSDQSEFKKYALQKLVDIILDGGTLEDIQQEIEALKQEFKTKSFKEIGKPVSCKTLKKYSDVVDMTGSMKGVPYMVKASMMYNQMKSDRDPEIMPGDKILFCYVIHPTVSGIAIPLSLNSLPDFLEELPIDYEKEWKKLKKTITNYLESLGWDIRSRNKQLKKNLFGF